MEALVIVEETVEMVGQDLRLPVQVLLATQEEMVEMVDLAVPVVTRIVWVLRITVILVKQQVDKMAREEPMEQMELQELDQVVPVEQLVQVLVEDKAKKIMEIPDYLVSQDLLVLQELQSLQYLQRTLHQAMERTAVAAAAAAAVAAVVVAPGMLLVS